jgi:HrpA-like RNA helicase
VALRLWSDDQLQRFSAVIIDEFHERNLELDLLLALCQTYPKSQLIVMSATFAADSLASHLSGVHLSGEGRLFEVQVNYRSHGNTAPQAQGLIDALIPLIDEGLDRAPQPGGDLLVFLPGKGEIHDVEARLYQHWRAHHRLDEYEAIPLHGGLSLDEQSRVFKPATRRRVILSTNVAETSLTVPKVSVVIDSGLVRRTRYDRGRGALTLAEVAHDSAEQRRGRAGRLGPGLCLRMWSQGAPLKPYTPPEIHRESLTSLLLTAAACGVDPRTLPFVDAPKAEALKDAEEVLSDLSAIDAQGALTSCGEALFKLGVDVSLGRWLVEGIHGGPLRDLIDLVSALSCRRSLFLRGMPDDPSVDLRTNGCDAVGLIRAMRISLRDARRYHLNGEVLCEAHQNRMRLCRGLTTDQIEDINVRDDLTIDHPIDRRALAMALLCADPRAVYVHRHRRGHEAWCGRGPELTLSQDSGLSLARRDDTRLRCESLLVLEQHAAVKRGRHAQHLITSAMPIPLAWLKNAGLGEERLGIAKLSRGKLTVDVERVFAKKVLETRSIEPKGAQARAALTYCILAGQRWPKITQEIEHRLDRLALSS